MNTAERIKQIRATIGISSVKFAEELGIPVRTLGSYERNEAQPGLKFFKLLNLHYNVNLNWLITGSGEMFTQSDLTAPPLEKFDDKDLNEIFELLKNDAAKEMIMKFAEIRKGNKEAVDELIQNLNGIKAVL